MLGKHIYLSILCFSVMVFEPAFAQDTVIEAGTSKNVTLARAATTKKNQKVTNRRRAISKGRGFFYVNGYYSSFADEVYVKNFTAKEKARSIFSGYGLGADYIIYSGRMIYGWTLSAISGSVDTQRTQSAVHPRRSFLGIHSGPEVGYRVNADMDLSYGLALLYRDIQTIGSSMAVSNQLNVKFRFTPKLTFFQSFGNYGKPTAYSYSIGLRWLL